MLDHFARGQEALLEGARGFAAACNPATRGWLWTPIKPMLESLTARGRAGSCLAGAIMIPVMLFVVVPIGTAILLWGTFGSLVMLVSFAGRYGTPFGIMAGVLNFIGCAALLGFLSHGLVWEGPERNVFGGASWAEDLDAISRAGLKGGR